MKFNIWTFGFQLINFFVLLLILRRLLYRPVREIMEKRRAEVRKTIEEAGKVKAEAEALKEEYEKKTSEMDSLRADIIEKAEDEAEEKRGGILKKAQEEAELALEKERSKLELERKKTESALKDLVVKNSLSYATAILSDFSDENLHGRILEKLMEGLPGIAGEVKEAAAAAAEGFTVEITSAYPLTEPVLGKVRNEFESAASGKVTLKEKVDSGLISGAVIRVFDRVYDASLKGQLKAFEQSIKRVE